jgi:hypothetical protein
MKFIKVIILILAAVLIYFVAIFSINHDISEKLRKNQDIKILFLASEDNKFNGAYLINYSPSKNVIFICNLNGRTRFIKNREDNNPIYLQDLFQQIYYKNKRNLSATLPEFIRNIEKFYAIRIDYFYHFDDADINALNNNFQVDLDTKILLSSVCSDEACMLKYLNLKPFLQKLHSIKFLKLFYKPDF